MVLEAKLGENLGITEKGVADHVKSTLQKFKLPVNSAIKLDGGMLIEAMKGDKKAVAGHSFSFSLLTTIGHCKLVHGVSEIEARKILSN